MTCLCCKRDRKSVKPRGLSRRDLCAPCFADTANAYADCKHGQVEKNPQTRQSGRDS